MTRNLLFLIVTILAWEPGFACSSFFLDQAKVLGKNYDWNHEKALILINKRGTKKKALSLRPGENGAEWVSRYGNLTFNQYGREFPNGGMNEAGLVVEILWLNSSVYEPSDTRPILNELSWIQYQLDNYSLTQEVIDHVGDIRISNVYAKVHYLVCDQTAKCATFEWLDGKPEIHEGTKLEIPAITNHTYRESLQYAKRFTGLGGSDPVPSGPGSLDRFVRIASGLIGLPFGSDAFQLLNSVQGSSTVWSLAYDLPLSRVFYQTQSSPARRYLDLNGLDYSCRQPVLALDVQQVVPGQSQMNSELRPYDKAVNLAFLKENLSDIPQGESLADVMNAFVDTTRCEAP